MSKAQPYGTRCEGRFHSMDIGSRSFAPCDTCKKNALCQRWSNKAMNCFMPLPQRNDKDEMIHSLKRGQQRVEALIDANKSYRDEIEYSAYGYIKCFVDCIVSLLKKTMLAKENGKGEIDATGKEVGKFPGDGNC